MRLRLRLLALATATVAAAGAAGAQARTLGITAPPAGSTHPVGGCGPNTVIAQVADAPATPYIVPSGGGSVTRWQTNTTGATPGLSVTFLVLRYFGLGSYSVVGKDTETVPNPLPANNLATFTLATPIPVLEGDTLGLYTNSGAGIACLWEGGSTPAADILTALNEPSPPASGQTLNPAFGNSPGRFALNLAATLSATFDPGVATATSPAKPSVGNQAVLSSTVTNHGPATDAITFRDTVPSGLTVNAASAGNGFCSTSGQVVTCLIIDLPVGSSVPVNVVVTPTQKGSYLNQVAVSAPSEDVDPVTTDNSATVRLNVANFAPAVCRVPKLKGTPAGVAKPLLKLLGCPVKVKKRKGGGVARGSVLKTKPGAGTYAFGRKVTVLVRK